MRPAQHDFGLASGDLLPDGVPGAQRFAGLIDMAQPDGLADPQGARIGGLGARDHPEQGGLARAVRADHADDAAGRQVEVETVDQQAVAVALGQPLGLDHHIAEARAGRDDDLGGLRRPVRGLGQQRIVGAHPRPGLGLAGAGRGADPLQLARERAPAGGLLFLLDGQPLLLLVQPGGIVALPRDTAPAVELEDPAGDVVQEVAVVGDRDHGAGVVVEETLQPGDRFGVQMVGRFVQQQHVGLAQQQPAERDPAPLAARQRGHRGLRRRAAQRIHRDRDLAVEVPRIGRLDLLLQRPLLLDQGVHRLIVQRLGEPGADRLETLDQRPGRRRPLDDVAVNILALVELRLLGQKPHLQPVRRPPLAGERGIEAGHDPEQRRFAGAVQAQHADLGAGKKRQRDVLEDFAAARIGPAEAPHDVDVLRHAHGMPMPSIKRKPCPGPSRPTIFAP